MPDLFEGQLLTFVRHLINISASLTGEHFHVRARAQHEGFIKRRQLKWDGHASEPPPITPSLIHKGVDGVSDRPKFIMFIGWITPLGGWWGIGVIPSGLSPGACRAFGRPTEGSRDNRNNTTAPEHIGTDEGSYGYTGGFWHRSDPDFTLSLHPCFIFSQPSVHIVQFRVSRCWTWSHYDGK